MLLSTESVKEFNCKVVGYKGVGKTSLLLSYEMKRFPTEIDLRNVKARCPGLESVAVKGETWTVELFDTPTLPQEYSNLRIVGYTDMQVVLACFSVVLPSSVESLKTQWIPEIARFCPKVPYILVGTQIDLRDDDITVEKLAQNNQKPITIEEGKELAVELKAVKYLECSVLTQEGLQDLIEEVVLVRLKDLNKLVPVKKKKKRKCLIL